MQRYACNFHRRDGALKMIQNTFWLQIISSFFHDTSNLR